MCLASYKPLIGKCDVVLAPDARDRSGRGILHIAFIASNRQLKPAVDGTER